MDRRETKPIRLRSTERRRVAAVSGMLGALEGKPASGSKARPASRLWTQEFLASGKPGKLSPDRG